MFIFCAETGRAEDALDLVAGIQGMDGTGEHGFGSVFQLQLQFRVAEVPAQFPGRQAEPLGQPVLELQADDRSPEALPCGLEVGKQFRVCLLYTSDAADE